MPALGTPTLEQLRAFVTAAEAGSFSAAARLLRRRQSVISYAIASLERQLGGIALFDRSARWPVLTEAGVLLLADARKVLHGIEGLKVRAGGILDGLEAELAVVVDVMLPPAVLVEALAAFRSVFPTVTLRLSVEALGAAAGPVHDGICAVGICGPVTTALPTLEWRRLGGVRLLPVSAPGHPLAVAGGPVPRAALRDHVQLVLTDRSELTRGKDFGVLSTETWRLGDLGAKHALLRGGLGWGSMPEAAVEEDIAAGRLVVLRIEGWEPVVYPVFAVHRAGAPPGPAGRWLIERVAADPLWAPHHPVTP